MPRNDPKGLGVLVRRERERMGWTQDDLAGKLGEEGVDKGYISAIEIGTRRWPLKHIKALKEALGLDYVEMAIAAGILPDEARQTHRVGDAFPPGDPALGVIAIMREMPHKERKALLDYAEFQRTRGDWAPVSE